MDVFDPQKLDRQALKLFTDREIYRDAFWKTYDSLENGRSEVIYFYGVGGIGKSSLLEQIQRELEEHGNKNYVGYNFEKKEPKVCVLYDISRQLMKKYKKLQFPVFEHALVKYYNLIQEDGYVRQMLEKKGLLENHLVENSINAAGDVVPLTGLAFSIIKEMRNLYKYWKNKAKEKGDKAKYYKEISEFGQAKDLEKNLEHYFSIDAYDFLLKHNDGKPLVIMLDGYEVLVNHLANGDKAKWDDLWLRGEYGLLRQIPNTIWVIAGRERVEWDDQVLPEDHKFLLGNLSETDALNYFEKSGINDLSLAGGLYELTNGTPVFMDLCVKRYKKLKYDDPDRVPSLEAFGKNTEEIAGRYFRDMNKDAQIIMEVLSCLPDSWNDSIVYEFAERCGFSLNKNEYGIIKKLTLTEALDNEGKMYKLHETLKNIIFSQIELKEKKRMLNILKDLLFERVMNICKYPDYEYNLFSLLHICDVDYEFIELSLKEINDLGLEIPRLSFLQRSVLDYFDVFKGRLADSNDAEAIKKYISLSRRQIEAFDLLDDGGKAFSLAKELFRLCNGKTVDAESRAWILLLYGTKLNESDKTSESKALLREALDLVCSDVGISYECKLEVLKEYASQNCDFNDDKEYVRIQTLIGEMCDRELNRIEKEERGSDKFKLVRKVLEDKVESLRNLGLYDEALSLQNKICDMMLQNGFSVLDYCMEKKEIANTLCLMEQYDEALDVYQEILDKCTEFNDDPDFLMIYSGIRDCYLGLEDCVKAIEWGQRTIDSYRNIFGQTSTYVAVEEEILADIFAMSGDDESAEIHYKNAIEIYRERTGNASSDTRLTRNSLANLYIENGKYEKALELHLENLKCLEAADEDLSSINDMEAIKEQLSARFYEAYDYMMLNRFEESITLMNTNLSIVATIYGEDSDEAKTYKDIIEELKERSEQAGGNKGQVSKKDEQTNRKNEQNIKINEQANGKNEQVKGVQSKKYLAHRPIKK